MGLPPAASGARDSPMFRCEFTIRSDTRYLTVLRQCVPAAAEAAGFRDLPRKAAQECTLALIEAVDNAIFHAHGRRSSLPIRISVSVSAAAISIEVSDRGDGIGRTVEYDPDSMIAHGRGLFLIREIMDNVESRVRGGRHTLRMRYSI